MSHLLVRSPPQQHAKPRRVFPRTADLNAIKLAAVDVDSWRALPEIGWRSAPLPRIFSQVSRAIGKEKNRAVSAVVPGPDRPEPIYDYRNIVTGRGDFHAYSLLNRWHARGWNTFRQWCL